MCLYYAYDLSNNSEEENFDYVQVYWEWRPKVGGLSSVVYEGIDAHDVSCDCDISEYGSCLELCLNSVNCARA